MSRTAVALSLSAVMLLSGGVAGAEAAEPSAASVFLRGMKEVCAPWQAGAEQGGLYKALQADGWNVDLLPKMQGPWGSARFQPSRNGEMRGCGAILVLSGEQGRAGTTRAVLDWVARTYPTMTMTNQNKPVPLKSGPARAWTWAGETMTITFYVVDSITAETAPHVVLSIKPR